MAVEMLGYANINEEMAIQEAASAGMKSMEHLIRTVSQKNQQLQQCVNKDIDCREMADFTVSKFRKVISILNRTGHARFRRAPVQALSPSPALIPTVQNHQPRNSVLQPLNLFSLPPAVPQLTLDFTKDGDERVVKEGFGLSAAMSTSGNSSSTFVSSITGEGSVSNGKDGSPTIVLQPSGLAISAGKPPLSGKRCREHDQSDNISGKTSGSSRCHCKKRKSKVKRTIRVPAISSKVADIPPDEYSWRKYGQKPIKGSPYPRGYYKCSTVRGCPARKHVERANDDPTMLIVTYEAEHRHTHEISGAAPPSQLVVFESKRG